MRGSHCSPPSEKGNYFFSDYRMNIAIFRGRVNQKIRAQPAAGHSKLP
jgi:hypothetical protein